MSWKAVERLQAIRYEYIAIEAAAALVETEWGALHTRPQIVITQLGLEQLRNASEHLEATYLIRQFAEYEIILRSTSCHARYRGRKWPQRTRDLINKVAMEYNLLDRIRDDADNVRRYRNALVHDSREPYDWINFEKATSTLCRFAAALP